MTTNCARYKVRKFFPADAPHGKKGQWRYQCSALTPHGWFLDFGPWLRSFAEAQMRCEQHGGALSQPL